MIISQLKKITLSLVSALVLAITIIAPGSFAATGDIVDVATNAPTFSTLVSAVKAADLVATLQGVGPFTVLAPTNAAFAKIPADVLEKLLLPANKAVLASILKYHVIAGKAMAADVIKLTTTPTVEGSPIKITVTGTVVKLNDTTTVTATDTAATNGVIHTIDTVLIPPTVDLTKLVAKAVTPTTPVTTPAKATPRTGGNNFAITLMTMAIFLAVGLVAKSKFSR